ncbi:MAG: SH3 domain-containing protein [Gammaproteobacteria bacterium]|nr:SH3 domain-containing protein [Gammaproteobacteria bacterium]
MTNLLRIVLIATIVAGSVDALAANPFKKLIENIQKSVTNPRVEQASLIGSWQGAASIPGTQPYPVYITLLPDGTGSWMYPSVNCAGLLVATTPEGGALRYLATVLQGSCQPGSKVLLTPQTGEILKWEWFDATGNVGLSANLAKIAAVAQSAAAPARAIPTDDVRMRQALSALSAQNLQPNVIPPNSVLPTNPPLPGSQAFGNMQFAGTVTKSANMRSGPATSEPVLVVVPEGTPVAIAPRAGDWYQVHAVIDGKPVSGWIHHSLIQTQMVALPTPAPVPIGEPVAGQIDITYAGYSERFLDIRSMLVSGDLDKIEETYAQQEAETREKIKREKKLKERIGLLRWLERGTLALDQGTYDAALTYLTTSEELIEKRQGRSILGGALSGMATRTIETVSGNEEMQPYSAEGWEKVLMLNYKTITYLMQGDRRAYNVTRRAIDWQNIEKKAFDKELANLEAKLEKKNARNRAKREKEAAKQAAKKKKNAEEDAEEAVPEEQVASTAPPAQTAIEEALKRAFAPTEKKASSVASAYVNPFGFYVSGMIQEFESYADRSLRDNARISYQKALELNPESDVLARAVEDMKKPSADRNVNLVHVIVANGFVPEKKVLTYWVATQSGGVIPLKLPIYEPVTSRVARIEVHSKSGKHLATLALVADIEALCLRQQKDMQRLQVLRAFASYLVSGYLAGTAEASTGLVGTMIGKLSKARQDSSSPDTRSWMSLPATMQATRLRLRKGVDQLKIVTFDDNGVQLASQNVDVNPQSHGVVYVRTFDNVMYAQVVKQLWF